ncbi:uncharacterized protein CC84DRAFT_841056 [Paraphaeosphaeria sporulosa]|uniref:Uncharacterized protein n=1 Tax=Paraphaeosphaeria sporulosa TaxID=1460663 RepID=A0A177C7F0_9PLEO|nr:uncharacterized protein CC84DRAFT_841056 [Paraphaeosphaeria sporulosa]OAG03475.1 hypothetical protein CC84DRAFT_841056 [Paraphaeosphaeria sporulosa]
MATPSQTITTVSGRRCTRSRARTATSTLTSTTTSIIESTSTSTQNVQSIQSSSIAEAPSPPPPASSTSTDTTGQATSTEAVSTAIAVSTTRSILVDVPAASSTLSDFPVPVASSSAPVQSVLPEDPSPDTQPVLSQPTDTGIPTGGSAGVIAPDTGTTDGGGSLTLPLNGSTNVAPIAGGVVGGFVGLALVSALLFLCLRRRNDGTFEKWQQRLSEKREREEGGLSAKIRAIPEKIRGIPAGLRVFVARLKGDKSGPASNPYRKHTRNASSVYSVGTARRSQSISEPPSKFRQQLRGFGGFGRMPTLKRSRTFLQKKQDSLVVGQNSPFPNIVDDPVLRNSNAGVNPFADPPDPPKSLQLLNPDPASPQPQQSGPLAPKPAAKSERNPRDPFASILDEIDAQNGSGTPEWLRETAQQHKRTTSSQTALHSNPVTYHASSIYTDRQSNPFFDPSDPPPLPPTRPLPPTPSKPANTYAPLPQFNATSSTVSRMSQDSFFFGEPGPSRPATNVFGRGVRQSDPFDLDRPEVLSFGKVGGRMVRGSVTRQNSRKRSSTVPNWINVNDGPYESGSTALRNPSIKRKP